MKKRISIEALRYVQVNYGKMPVEEMAQEYGVTEGTINKWASILRKAGYDIPKLHRTDFLIEQMKKEDAKLASLANGNKE